MVKLLSAFAPAKINLYLRVVGRRADGYHELDSVFIPITLGDQIAIEARPSQRRTVTLRGDLGGLPADERNLAVRAASRFMAEFEIDAEIVIQLEKQTPPGAGLGGGSSDAATVLQMLATLMRIEAAERVARIAVELGADVPFFLNPVPARVGGIGERIIPLGAMPKLPLLIAVPPIEVPTAAVFRELKPAYWSGAASEEALRAIVAGEISPDHLVNDLAKVAMARWPEIARVKNRLEEAGARAASMTGSGAGVFGIFATIDDASRGADDLRRRAPELRVFAATIYAA